MYFSFIEIDLTPLQTPHFLPPHPGQERQLETISHVAPRCNVRRLQSPAVFTAPQAQTYDVIIQESGAYSFDHWLDGSPLPDEKVVLGTAPVSLVAVMARRPIPIPPSLAIVQVVTVDLAGNPLNGLYVSIKASARAGYSPLAYAPKVTIVPSNYGNFFFDHWDDGTLTQLSRDQRCRSAAS